VQDLFLRIRMSRGAVAVENHFQWHDLDGDDVTIIRMRCGMEIEQGLGNHTRLYWYRRGVWVEHCIVRT
jgi:hypothetical protein